jgi:type I restriction enzyme S subunit
MISYPKYKETTEKWFPPIPFDWTIFRIKRLVNSYKYYQIGDGDHGAIKPEMYKEEGIPYIRVQNLTWDGRIIYDGMVYLTPEIHKANLKSKLIPGDILIAKTGATIGKLGFIPLDIEEANTTSSVGKVSIDLRRFNSKFVLYYLSTPHFKDQIWADAAQKSAQPGFNIDDLVDYTIPIPSLPEQHAIVRFLDYKTGQIDSFIANRQKQIELLKEQKAGIINKAVTKGINPNAKMKDSGIEWIGDVPEHWSVTKLKFVSKIFGRIGFRGYTINDLVEKGEGAITISPSNMKANEMNFESCTYISWFKYEESPEIKIFNGDVLFVKTGSTYGKVSMVENLMEPATINPQILVFKKIKTNPMFFYHQLRSKLIQAHVKTSVIGGTIPTISQEKIGNYYFLLPSKSEQEQIIEHITNETKIIDELISKYQKQIDLMQEYRTSLISQAVTGKIDVREWQPKIQQSV